MYVKINIQTNFKFNLLHNNNRIWKPKQLIFWPLINTLRMYYQILIIPYNIYNIYISLWVIKTTGVEVI